MLSAALRGRAFGLALELSTRVDGLALHASEVDAEPLEVHVGGATAAHGRWDGPVSALLQPEDPAEGVTIERNALGDHRVRAAGWGTFLLSHDVRRLDCIPAERAPEWCWQRMLVARVLPFASTLRGFEVLYASAVAVGDGVVALVGAPGSGKTAVALNLVAEGAALFSDDVLALQTAGGAVLAQPGSAVATTACSDALAVAACGVQVERVASPDDWRFVRVMVRREERSLPLRAVCLLERGKPFDIVPEADPGLVLDASLKVLEDGADDTLRHLASCAAVAQSARLLRMGIPWDMPAAEAARRLWAVL